MLNVQTPTHQTASTTPPEDHGVKRREDARALDCSGNEESHANSSVTASSGSIFEDACGARQTSPVEELRVRIGLLRISISVNW
jgi:hypothetical protein